jgi:hypothetical protein
MSRFNVIFSGDFLLRDAGAGEPATSGRKRWTEGFHGRSVGHHSHGWPVFAVTSQTARELANWSARHREQWFQQCRTWRLLRDDNEARAVAESHNALYEFNDCYLTASWRNQSTGEIHYGRAIQLHNGLHLVEGYSWMAVDDHLVDVIHGVPAEVNPVWLPLTGEHLRLLTDGGELTVAATFDGTPAQVVVESRPAKTDRAS